MIFDVGDAAPVHQRFYWFSQEKHTCMEDCVDQVPSASVKRCMQHCCIHNTIRLEECALYLDDVIYSKTWEEHVDHIRALFDRLVWSTLTVNLAKCEFAQGTVTY